MGGDNGEERGKGFQEQLKGHMDKIKGGWNHGREVEMAGVRGVLGGKCRQLYLNYNKIK